MDGKSGGNRITLAGGEAGRVLNSPTSDPSYAAFNKTAGIVASLVVRMHGFLIIAFLIFAPLSALAAEMSPEAINDAQWSSKADALLLIKAQVLLDRAHFSPGEIDGRDGDNYKKALNAFAEERRLESRHGLTEEIWKELTAVSSEPLIIKYTMSARDVEGPFLDKVPTKLDDMKGVPAMAYGSAREAIAERFHMSESLLSALNPGQKFDQKGDEILVVNVSSDLKTKAARLEVDKSVQTLRAFDRQGKLVAFFPVTAGSTDKPAPSGELKIRSIARNPTYRYNPAYAFKGVRSEEPFTIGPGPNNPVGSVWIGLPGKGYGIHGTPDPSKVGKTESHGCVRLTNWDALQVAELVSKSTPVAFVGEEKPKTKAAGRRNRHR